MDDQDWQECQDCIAGDSGACASLLKRHEPQIARHVWRFSRNRDVQAELVQEVFVEAYVSLRRFKRQGVPFVHWLACIATRVGYRYWKQQARRRRHQPLEGLDAPAQVSATDDPADSAAAAALLHHILADLPPADRLVLTLMYFDELSVKQIAQQTGWNGAMVKMRLMRARRRLKQIIEERKLQEKLSVWSNG